MLIARIDMVNKKQYEESEIYKEIKIIIPRTSEELKKDFEYLDLDYENYTIQDTHIKECVFMDRDDEDFAVNISSYVNNILLLLLIFALPFYLILNQFHLIF